MMTKKEIKILASLIMSNLDFRHDFSKTAIKRMKKKKVEATIRGYLEAETEVHIR